MLWLGLMALGALLLLSCGARRAENLKREQAELKREQAAFLASRCDFRRASGRCDSSYKPKASEPARLPRLLHTWSPMRFSDKCPVLPAKSHYRQVRFSLDVNRARLALIPSTPSVFTNRQ